MKKITVPLAAIFGVASIIIGILAGYNRLGWTDINTSMGGEHAALMVGSFLGTVILLERVVTLKNKLFLFFPIINGLSLPLFFLELPFYALLCLSVGALAMCFVYLDIMSRVKELGYYIMLVGAFCWLIGNVLVIKFHLYPMALPWWISFLLLTIVGERLELTKFLPVKKRHKILLTSLLSVAVISLCLFFHSYGQVIAGIAILGVVFWLLKYDMVRKSLKKEGIHRYGAVMLGIGYIWLGVFAVFLISSQLYDISYDALVHSFFIGFVMNMIFAHAPIILPGVAKLGFYPYHPFLFVSGVLLQLSLIIRLAYNFFPLYDLKYYGGIFNGIFILAFFITLGVVVAYRKMHPTG